jgi:hypothetical protein
MMNPYTYALYLLVLEHGMTPEDVYLACKGKTNKSLPLSIRLGPFYTETIPTPDSAELMRTWLYRTFTKVGWHGGHAKPLYPLMTFGKDEVYFMPLSLANFIAKHATKNIKLTWWDRLKRRF